MDYATMPAGPEMDALVAENVMGNPPPWEHDMTDCEDAYYDSCRRCGARGPDVYGWEGPAQKECAIAAPYSANLAAAWEVVERLQHKGFELQLSSDSGKWECGFALEGAYPLIAETAETAPLAICRAALKTVVK